MMRQQQRGAILIIGMILMAIITIVGLSTISTTQLEEKMAANLQQSNEVFQAAEAAIEEGIDSGKYLNTTRISGGVGTATTVTNEDTRINSTFQATYIGNTTPSGDDAASVDLGNDGQSLTNYNFTIAASAGLSNTGAAARHVQGIFQKALTQDPTAIHTVKP